MRRRGRNEVVHAAYIEEYENKAVYVCTDPSRHRARGASELLGVTDVPERLSEQHVDDYITKSSGALHRLAFATALLTAEASVEYNAEPWYVDYLEKRGYEITDVERKSFENKSR